MNFSRVQGGVKMSNDLKINQSIVTPPNEQLDNDIQNTSQTEKRSKTNKNSQKNDIFETSGEKQNQSPNKNISKIKDFANVINTRLKFDVNENKGKTIVYVIDRKTDEIIRTIPPEELSRLRGKLDDIKRSLA